MTDVRIPSLWNWAEPRLSQLVEQAYEEVLDRVPLLRTAQLVPHEDLRCSIEANLRFVLAALVQPLAKVDTSAPCETGRRRAHQGVPLPEVLRTYRIAFGNLWNELVKAARAVRGPGAADALLSASTLLWEAADEHAVVLTEAYRAASVELLVAEQRRRSALVEALLTGHPGPEGGPWEAAVLLNLLPDADLVVVAADTHGLAQESLPGIERQLADAGVVSGWRLTPSLQLGIVSLRVDQHETVMTALRDKANARTGVSPLYRTLTDTPRALQLARAALSLLPAGSSEVHAFIPSPLAALMACEPDEGARLASEVLGPVLELGVNDRATVLDTLFTYFDQAGSAERAAQELHCHANTVRYRLRRVQELTGRSLSDPRGVAELAGAVYALHAGANVTAPVAK